MNAKKIYESPIINLDDFINFIKIDDTEREEFILKTYDYINNYIKVELSVTDPSKVVYDEIDYNAPEYKKLKQDAIRKLKSDLNNNESEEICLNLNSIYEEFEDENGNLEFKGYPSFLYYSAEMLGNIKDNWIIYAGNDSLEIYKENKFIDVIKDLKFVAPLVEQSKETSSYNIGYVPKHFKREYISPSIIYFILFKSSGYEISNIFNYDYEKDTGEILQTLFNVNKAHDFHLIFFDGNKYRLFSGDGKHKLAFDELHMFPEYFNDKGNITSEYSSGFDKALNNMHNNLIKELGKSENGENIPGSMAHGVGGSKGAHSSKKPVTQLDPAGGAVKTWNSATEASEELGISRTSIVKAAKGQQSVAGGFKWKYA